jgi:hypothetical protein
MFVTVTVTEARHLAWPGGCRHGEPRASTRLRCCGASRSGFIACQGAAGVGGSRGRRPRWPHPGTLERNLKLCARKHPPTAYTAGGCAAKSPTQPTRPDNTQTTSCRSGPRYRGSNPCLPAIRLACIERSLPSTMLREPRATSRGSWRAPMENGPEPVEGPNQPFQDQPLVTDWSSFQKPWF